MLPVVKILKKIVIIKKDCDKKEKIKKDCDNWKKIVIMEKDCDKKEKIKKDCKKTSC